MVDNFQTMAGWLNYCQLSRFMTWIIQFKLTEKTPRFFCLQRVLHSNLSWSTLPINCVVARPW